MKSATSAASIHERKIVYYASNEGNPLEQQIWQVSFDGERKQLSTGPGNHQANFAPNSDAFSDKYSSRMNPPTFQLCRGPAASARSTGPPTPSIPTTCARPSSFRSKRTTAPPSTQPCCCPPAPQMPASVPLIVNPYGGPGPQEVADRWADALLFDELLAEHGFAVLHADNRGTGMRGRDFAQAAYHNFGPVQLEDQLTVDRRRARQISATRRKAPRLVGMELGRHLHPLRADPLRPLSRRRLRRSRHRLAQLRLHLHRALHEPARRVRPTATRTSPSSTPRADLKGHLLLVHGTGDDNVHIENTVQFIQKLIEAGVPYDLQIYPRKTHSIAGPDVRTHLYNRILAQFEQYLMPPAE